MTRRLPSIGKSRIAAGAAALKAAAAEGGWRLAPGVAAQAIGGGNEADDSFFDQYLNPFNTGLGLYDTRAGHYYPIPVVDRENWLSRNMTGPTISPDELRTTIQHNAALMRYLSGVLEAQGRRQ
jgi:hypothetical protein